MKKGMVLWLIMIWGFVYAQEPMIKIVEVYAEKIGNLEVKDGFGLKHEVNPSNFGVNMGIGKKFISSIIQYNYQMIDIKKVEGRTRNWINYHEFMLGLRYFPMKPTFKIRPLAFRLTLGAAYGLDLTPTWKGMLLAGIFISPIRSVNGISINVIYKPTKYQAYEYIIQPSWILRLGIILGPTME